MRLLTLLLFVGGCTELFAQGVPVPLPPTTDSRPVQLPPLGLLPPPASLQAGQSPLPSPNAAVEPGERVWPINLATALRLAGATPLDVQIASRQVDLSAQQLTRARLLWVPNILVGGDYFHHEGLQQNFQGDIVKANRSSTMVGFGPNIVFSTTDALYAPLAARQELRARQALLQATTNDVTLSVAEVYFQLQHARGDLAGAVLARQFAQDVARKTEKLAEGLTLPLEANRARVELARRQQAEASARERWRVASAELSRLLRLNPTNLLEPVEPAFMPIQLIQESMTVDSLIPLALTNRPELQAHQAVVQATLARLKQEKMRPLLPSLAIRSVSTNPSGSLGYGTFGGGPNDRLGSFGGRFDVDVQLLWEFQSLGLGNRVRDRERQAENRIATLELFRMQDRIASEVSAGHAQIRSAAERLAVAEPALKDALELVNKSLEGMTQTRRVGELQTLIVRPQEVVAAVQLLGQANADFHAAVSDYNRGQFRLYRALGHPAQVLSQAIQPK
jgi:outer membrane protein TolC